MATKFTRDTFEKHLNSNFKAKGEGGTVADLTLIEVKEGSSSEEVDQFTALFRGSLDQRLPGTIHTLSHDSGGDHQLYLEPVAGQDEDHRYYEAAFCCLKKDGE